MTLRQPWRSATWTFAIVLTALAVVLGGCAGEAPMETADQTAAPREVPSYTIDQFLDVTAITGASVSPDKSKVLVSTDETGIFNAYAYPVDGSEPVQLTDSTTDAIFAVSYFPDDDRFLYTSMRSRGSRRQRATLAAVAVALLLGVGRELFNLWQSLTMPWMFFSMKDMVWNGVGIAIGLLLSRMDDGDPPEPPPPQGSG